MDRKRTSWIAVGLILSGLGLSQPSKAGRIVGQIENRGGHPLSGIAVKLPELQTATLSDANGSYSLVLPEGTYSVEFTSADSRHIVADVSVPFDGVTDVSVQLDWEPVAREVAVLSPFGFNERLSNVPASLGWIPRSDLASEAALDSTVAALRRTNGLNLSQNTNYDFNVNPRGFTGALDRGLAVRVDGRDTAEPFFGGQEWASLSTPLVDVAQVELLRSPSSARYGPNAKDGVLSLVTRRPTNSLDVQLRVAAGEDSARNADFRWAGKISKHWNFKAVGAWRSAAGSTISRVEQTEYSVPCQDAEMSDCLAFESASPTDSDRQATSGLVRFDKSLRSGNLVTLESSFTKGSDIIRQSELGRVEVGDVDWRWSSARYEGDRWRLRGNLTSRDAGDQTFLSNGFSTTLDSETWSLDAERRGHLEKGDSQWIIGVYHNDHQADSVGPAGAVRPSLLSRANRQTLLFGPVKSDYWGGYGQIDMRLSSALRALIGVRYEDDSLHGEQLSPRAVLAFAPAEQHTLWLGYNTGYRAPSFSERFLYAQVASSVNLAELEPLCALQGVQCGFDLDFNLGETGEFDVTPDTLILASGNPDLEVEEVQTIELGYRGVVGKVEIDIEVFRAQHDDFISDLLPLVGTSLGRVNDNLLAYQTPVGFPGSAEPELFERLQELLGELFPFLTNGPDGTPVVVLTSNANLGDADSSGAFASMTWRITRHLSATANYRWIDFDVDNVPEDLSESLQPNAPEHSATATISYLGSRFDTAATVHLVEDFRWADGAFQGEVDGYTSVDFVANVKLGKHAAAGVSVSNLFDSAHWETFGGDLLARRALATLSLRWR